MANVQRHRHFAANPIVAPVDLAVAIEIGDIVYLETDDVRPASSATQTSVGGTQAYVHARFAGIAASGHVANDAKVTQVRVNTNGEFEHPAAAGTYRIGTLITAAAGAGNAVLAQKVEVGTAGEAIGYCVRDYGVNPTKVLWRAFSSVVGGGPQAIA